MCCLDRECIVSHSEVTFFCGTIHLKSPFPRVASPGGLKTDLRSVSEPSDAVEKLCLPRERNFAWKNEAIRSAISDRWPQGRHFPPPCGTVGPQQKSFSTASSVFGIRTLDLRNALFPARVAFLGRKVFGTGRYTYGVPAVRGKMHQRFSILNSRPAGFAQRRDDDMVDSLLGSERPSLTEKHVHLCVRQTEVPEF